jgi:pimeloyl-ACP methyl ester carboxylesterase
MPVSQENRGIRFAWPLLLTLILIPLGTAKSMTTRVARVNGTKLCYEISGEGFPLVLISGGGLLDRRAWDKQVQSFAKRYRVVRYDIRGIGKSERPRAEFSHSQDLAALLRSLKIEKAHVVGLSFGGSIALDFALEHPEMVDGLVLASTATSSFARTAQNLQGLAVLSGIARKEGIDRVSQLVLDLGFFVAKTNKAGREKVRQIYRDNRDVFESGCELVTLWRPIEPSADNRLADVRARTLVILGENDSAAYKSMTENLRRIPGSSWVTIPGAGHVVNLDKPSEFNQAVLDFLGRR